MNQMPWMLCFLTFFLCATGCETKTKSMDRCGDGFLDPGEECDRDQMGVTTCQELGYYEQLAILTCQADCTINVSACYGRCGDGVIQTVFGEQCDGENQVLTTNFCRARGYYGGVHGCSPECMLDETRCLSNGTCGDGVWQEAYESCEGDELGGASCESLGYEGGTLACRTDCRFDVSGCTGGDTCGDGEVNGPEQCDGTNLNGFSCADLEGFSGGVLACGPDCRYDSNGCHAGEVCGDGVVVGDEECDGTNLMGHTCMSLGLASGVLACGPDCRYDTSGCSVQRVCGDGLIHFGEDCDGENLGGATCLTLGYSAGSGALGCTSGCRFNESLCVPPGNNSDLGSLTVGSGELVPEFSPETTEYTVVVPPSVTTLTVAGVPADPWATVAVSPSQPMALLTGENPVTLTVTAENGAQKVYSVVITRLETMNIQSPNVGTLVYVPEGTFQRDATATNLVTVTAFRMSRFEITRDQWVAVTGWEDPANPAFSSGENDPVQQVSWYDAIAFCNKLSLAEGLEPVYTVSGVDFSGLTYPDIPVDVDQGWDAVSVNWNASGYRLPTEMEWMWAAMDADLENPGEVNTTGWQKPFAGSTGINAIGDYAVYGYGTGQTGATQTQRSNPVGSKLANGLGFHDMSGNVWEWVWDWHGEYLPGPLNNPRGPDSGTARMLRGGLWNAGASYCAVGFRHQSSQKNRYNTFGFRVVRR